MDQPLPKNKYWLWFLVFDLGVVNLGLGYVFYQANWIKPVSQASSAPETAQVDECGANCRSYIDSQIAQITVPATPTPTPRLIAPGPATAAKTRTVAYVTVPGTGSTTANNLATLAGTDFYFNPSDYPGLVEVYFEVNMHLINGNGQAYIQLFDVTHGIGVQGSDVSTASQTPTTVVSGKVSFWAGKNLIKVQAKSLTADTAVFDSGRLRIVTEK